MAILPSIIEGVKSLWSATKSYYSAWSTLGRALNLKAETELLDAIQKKMVLEERYSNFTEEEVEQAKDILDELNKKINRERGKIAILVLPLFIFLIVIYGVIEIFLEVLRIVFS